MVAIRPEHARLISRGLAAAAFAGALYVSSRRRTGPPPRLVDWDRVRTIAGAIARRGPAPVATPADRDEYADMVRRSERLISAYTGEPLTLQPENVHAFDRVEWLDANIANFRELFEPVEAMNGRLLRNGSISSHTIGDLNSVLLSTQMGVLLGYLARRVLGQYDLALLGKEPVTTGRLYFVEPNIVQLERRLGLDPRDFRLWIALHETTHAYEFESHPWLREHMNQLLQRYFATLGDDLANLRSDLTGFANLARRIGSNVGRKDRYTVELVMTPEQRQVFRSLQALMCLLEGYSNHVMDQVGRSLLPTYQQMKARFEDRLRKKSLGEQLFAKLTGLDVKMEQYALGEKFVNAVVDRGGIDAMNRVWDGPERLPTLDEIKDPPRWLERVAA